ncbi:MAG TPA: hypothetical protein DCE56_16635 [Cyanobacteria bacterium UBA8553]|nr:hypothetical protein [Cyanobacteria bacterium UBA8553]HAJ61775.1 hypothetical protein [Cyanobacteria bacterium UBA8543]
MVTYSCRCPTGQRGIKGELARSTVAAATKAGIIVNSPKPALWQPKQETRGTGAIAFIDDEDLLRIERVSAIKLPYIVSALPS